MAEAFKVFQNNFMLEFCEKFILLFAFLLSCAGCTMDDSPNVVESDDLPSISILDAVFVEGNDTSTTVAIRVLLSGNYVSPVEVNYNVEAITAQQDVDFVDEGDGFLLFSNSEYQKTIMMTIIGDDNIEADEVFTVQLSNPKNVTLDKEIATITINDDDASFSNDGSPVSGFESPVAYPEMDLIWSNEFTRNSLNSSEWTWELGNGNNGWGNRELQFYREENTSLSGGHLVITAEEENVGNEQYTSSRIITMDKVEFKYGRVDIRAAMPQGQGIWPALWMLGANFDEVGWPACGEIDIMELVGHEPGIVHGTAHFGASPDEYRFLGRSKSLPGNETFADEFHVFSIVWESNKINWYVDGELYNSLTPSQVNPAPWPFNKEFFMIFNVAVGGQWPGFPDATTTFPQRMFVDYIRVFQEN